VKAVFRCIVCRSKDMHKKQGYFMSFLAHRYFDYEKKPITLLGSGLHYPPLMTNVFKCKTCGIVFTQLRPDPDEIGRYYSDYGAESYMAARAEMETGFSINNMEDPQLLVAAKKNKETNINSIIDGCCDFDSVRSVLDYGGDDGSSIPSYFKNAKKYLFDISDKKAIEGVEVVTDLDKIDPVDFLMCMEVFEHLSYPGAELEKMKNLCGPNTKILLTMPHDASEDVNDDGYYNVFHEHINHFSLKSTQVLMLYHGFKILKLASIEHIDPRFSTPIRTIYCLAEPAWFV